METGKKPYVSAIIAAAGQGTRMNLDINKQYIDLSGIPVLSRTLCVFERCDLINEIIVVINSEDIFYCKQSIIEEYGIKKVKDLVAGGRERQNSVYNGLCHVSKNCDVVIIHDGARPFIDERIIADCIDKAQTNGACTTAVPVKDTIKLSSDGEYVEGTIERNRLWAAQTPQAFRCDILVKAHERAIEDGFLGTDDTTLAERLGTKVGIVMGSYKNIKITTKEDLVFAEVMAQKQGID
ncbi:MAG: 2-C-methyl-D-erythritol 4-phosphate cytidylyltransferase [Clostridium sp.]|nr:2-C-methyl-D-erythritol 4-phosphate cytidylyltransferase [Clostridium sp.]